MGKQEKGSYIIDSFTENKEAEVSRLRFQVELFYEKELEVYRKAGLRDGMRIIDCGSGPGYLISNIARDLRECEATALEIDSFMVEHLRKNSVRDGKTLYEVREASIYETGLPDGYFDFAISRLVIEHLEEPVKALQEVRRILKPGGRFVITSNDFTYHLITYPLIPELDEMYNAYIRSRFSEGGNPLIARQLPYLLKLSGFMDIGIEVICVHSETSGDKAFLKAENVNISKSLVKEGFLNEETLGSLSEKWYDMLKTPGHALFRQLFLISGTKEERLEHQVGKESPGVLDAAEEVLSTRLLLSIPAADRKTRIESYLLGKIRKMLPDRVDIEPVVRLAEVDIDSLSAAEVSIIVQKNFNIKISIADILQRYSIRDIVEIIAAQTAGSGADNIRSEHGRAKRFTEGEL
jgi:ubiquinone/menaquinone biosynthesis C-methylase UbiE/acyl carrier protein